MPKLVKNVALLSLSALLLGGGVWIVGFGKVLEDLVLFPMWTIAAVLAVFILNLGVVSFRLSQLLHYFHINVPFSVALKASIQGHFASLFLVSLFGQVAGRHVVLRHFGTPPVFIASLTAIERIILFCVSGVLCLLGAVWLLDKGEITRLVGDISLTKITFVATLGLFASFWFGQSKFERKLLAGIRTKEKISQYLKVAIVTLFAQALVLMAFVLGGLGLDTDIGLVNLLAAAAITSFAASLPISVNGWGVREVAAIFAFGYVGVPSSSALAISILVGLCSTAVVLCAWPFALKSESRKFEIPQVTKFQANQLSIEKSATWGLVTACAIFIFFQMHIPLHGGFINLNLADPFALLALAAIATHSIHTRQMPRWSVPNFNTALLAVGALLFLAFLNGLQIIGVTQWALAGRVFGWLLLLGYLCIGLLTASYLGKIGVFRFIESMIATAVVIVIFHAVMRWLAFSGWLDPSGITPNFEGFSGNRNAFAFQLLVCSVLLLAYIRPSARGDERVSLGLLTIRQDAFLTFAHGAVLTGLVFTGSRAGILTGIGLLLFSWAAGFSDRRMLFRSIFYSVLIWVAFAWVLPWFSQLLTERTTLRFAVQSAFSKEASNLERWETIRRGFEMWRDSPWVGEGLGVFIEMSPKWFKQPIVIHSTPVWILAEFGIFGALIMIATLAWIVIALARAGFAKPSQRAVIMLLLVFVIFGLVHEIFYQRIFWLVLGLCLALPFRPHVAQIGRPKPR